jgi:hypothetical protein
LRPGPLGLAARHMRGQVSAHELYTAGNAHSTADKVRRCSADVINAFIMLDVAGVPGDGQIVAVVDSQMGSRVRAVGKSRAVDTGTEPW